MGMSMSTIIGPYIRIVKGKKDVPSNLLSCPDKDCSNHKSDMKHINFCPKCGSKVSSITFLRKSNSDYSDCMDTDTELFQCVNNDVSEMIPENCDFLFENLRRPKDAPKSINNFNENGGLQEFDPHNLVSEIKWFKAHHDKWIKKFKEYFGEENVTVGYGIASYWC